MRMQYVAHFYTHQFVISFYLMTNIRILLFYSILCTRTLDPSFKKSQPPHLFACLSFGPPTITSKTSLNPLIFPASITPLYQPRFQKKNKRNLGATFAKTLLKTQNQACFNSPYLSKQQ